VPEWKPAKQAERHVVVDAQNRSTELIVDSDRIREHVHTRRFRSTCSSYAVGVSRASHDRHIVVSVVSAGKAAGAENRTFIVRTLASVDRAQCSTVGRQVRDPEWLTAARCKERRQCPSAENPSEETLLSAEERLLIEHQQAIGKLHI